MQWCGAKAAKSSDAAEILLSMMHTAPSIMTPKSGDIGANNANVGQGWLGWRKLRLHLSLKLQ